MVEKYCKSCGRVFKDSDFKLCPYCGNQLSTRVGRQPIPRKLRHQVFQRDNYRCRECGATNKQTRLHVDHIVPVAKGGTNDLSNLQTLCESCNKAKYTDEWVGGQTDLEVTKNELYILKEQLNNKKINEQTLIKYCNTRSLYVKTKEELFDIIVNWPQNKINNFLYSLEVYYNLESLGKIDLYKKYKRLKKDSLLLLCKHESIEYTTPHDIVYLIVCKYDEDQILDILNPKRKKISDKEEAIKKQNKNKQKPLKNILSSEKQICSYCGKKISIHAYICPYCLNNKTIE